MKEIALVFMVAGISSRFGNIKPLVEVSKNETLIERSLKQAIPYGFSKIIFIVGNKTEKPFLDKFDGLYHNIPVYYAHQLYNPLERNRPYGTADALCSLKGLVDCPFVLCNGDVIYGGSNFKVMAEHLKRSKEMATLGYVLGDCLSDNGLVNKGVFSVKGGYVTGIKELIGIDKNSLKEAKLEDLCNKGIYAFYPRIIDLIYPEVQRFKDECRDRDKEIYLTDVLAELIRKRKINLRIYKAAEKCFDITNKQDEKRVVECLKNS